MKLKNFWTIAKKEFFTYLNSPVAYVILVPFLILNAFLFLRSALVLSDANLRPMIEMLPWFLMIIGPALAMKTFAEEKRRDTLELMYAHPVSEWTVVFAKYLGLLLFYGLMLAATLPLPISLAFFSTQDWGLVIGQYLGALFVGSVFIATGLTASALVGNAVGGFLAGTAINFVFMLIGLSFVTLMFPGFIGRFINELAIMTHVTSISRGVIDLRDVLYFGTFIGLMLTLSALKLSERKVAEIPLERKKLLLIAALTLIVGLVGNLVVYEYPLRIDLTSNRRYSLSPGTKELLKQLPDRVTVSLYASQNLPGPMQVTLRETSDWLKDFKSYGKKVSLRTVLTDASAGNKTEALQRGIREVQFNQIGASSFQVATGFLGLEVRFGDKTETIDFIEDSSNLEYQLGRILLKLTQDNRQKVGLLTSVSDVSVSQLSSYLREQYDLTYVSNTSKAEELAGLSGLVVVDDGSETNATTAALVKQYLDKGGSILAFVDAVTVNPKVLSPTRSSSALLGVFSDWGITIKHSLAYDTQLHESVTLGSGSVRYMLPYPFWVRALVKKNHLPADGALTNVLLGWASTIETLDTEGVEVSPLLTTGSQTGGVQEGVFTVNPNDLQGLAKPTGGEKTLAVVAQRESQRLVVVADANIVADDFLQGSQENQVFTTNVIDWVAADPILNQIPRRSQSRNVFTFSSPSQVQLVQYLNIGAPAVVAAGFGLWWLMRRKKQTQRVFNGGVYAN